MADYNPNIPLGTTNLSTSQGQIANNFQQLNAIFGTDAIADHYAWDDVTVARRGLHKRISVPVPLSVDPAGLSGTQSVIYTKSVSGVAQAFFANSSTVSQLTGLASTFAANGSAVLPGGLTVKWGNINVTPNFSSYSFSSAFTTSAYAIVGNNIGGTAIIGFQSLSTSGFQAKNSTGGTVPAYYIAVGY